jgi:molecular chaperone DnaK (HSP70)
MPAQLMNAFGIDFGEAKTRVAGFSGGVPYLMPPGAMDTSITMEVAHLTKGSVEQEVDALRSKLRLQKYTQNDGSLGERAASRFFKKVCRGIKGVTPFDRPKAVITVPYYYTLPEREQLRICATAAGFDVLELLNDYAAVLHSFVRGKADRSGKMLVISIGADAVTTAIANVSRTSVIEILAARSASGKGATNLVDTFAEYLQHRFERGSIDLSEESEEQVGHWKTAAEDILYGKAQSNGEIFFLFEHGIEIRVAEVLDLISDCLKTTITFANEVMKESRVSRDELKFVLLVGGIFKSKFATDFLATAMPKQYRLVLNADKSACYGAALRAAVLQKLIGDPALSDVKPPEKESGIQEKLKIMNDEQQSMHNLATQLGQQKSSKQVDRKQDSKEEMPDDIVRESTEDIEQIDSSE